MSAGERGTKNFGGGCSGGVSGVGVEEEGEGEEGGREEEEGGGEGVCD